MAKDPKRTPPTPPTKMAKARQATPIPSDAPPQPSGDQGRPVVGTVVMQEGDEPVTADERAQERAYALTALKWDRVCHVLAKVGPAAISGAVVLTLAWMARPASGDALNVLPIDGRLVAEGVGVLGWILTAVWGYRARKLRQDTVQEMSPYRTAYERLLHPGRTSSELTPRGNTPPGEQP